MNGRFISDLSYGIYLWHWPLLWAVGTLPLPKAVKVLIFVPLLVGVCLFNFKYFEVPARRFARSGCIAHSGHRRKLLLPPGDRTAEEDLYAGPAP